MVDWYCDKHGCDKLAVVNVDSDYATGISIHRFCTDHFVEHVYHIGCRKVHQPKRMVVDFYNPQPKEVVNVSKEL